MRRVGWGYAIVAGLILPGSLAQAQTPLDALDQELKEIKQNHQAASSQTVTTLLDELDAASRSPDAALDLYQKAGGGMPDSAPVQTEHEHETPDEKAARQAIDASNSSALANVAQIHCGMMRFAALFIVKPDTKDLQDNWVAWLKTAAQIYPQFKQASDEVDAMAAEQQKVNAEQPNRKRGSSGGGGGGAGNNRIKELMRTTMKDSVISKYLDYYGWGDKEQGQWKIKDLPEMYRKAVLDPLRTAHKAEVLEAWDVYIAMCQADQTDADKWANVDSISLEFDKSSDDFALSPTTEKVQTLVKLLHTNPNHPRIDEMLSRTAQMVKDLRAQKGGEVAPSSDSTSTGSSASGDSNVTVTTTTSGDATIVTTTTNAPPATPKP